MAISIVDMLLVFSGASSTDQSTSVGGAISTQTGKEVRGQSTTAPSNVTGVTVVDAYGNIEGVGILFYTNASDFLSWRPPGSSFQTGKTITGDGLYTIGSAAGYLIVDVTFASLPGSNQQDSLTVTNVANNMFDNVTETQSLNGNEEYRCFYVVNNHATDTAYNVTLWISSQPEVADSVAIALDSNGNNGTALGPLADTEDSTNLLSGLTFTSPTTSATGLVLGTMAAGDEYPIWVRRTTPVDNRQSKTDNKFALGLYLTSS